MVREMYWTESGDLYSQRLGAELANSHKGAGPIFTQFSGLLHTQGGSKK